MASYERPLFWMGAGQSDEHEALASLERQYTSQGNLLDPVVQEDGLPSVLDDPDKKIDAEFRVPPDLRIATEFWLKIFTQYTSQHYVLFDEHHQEIIYEVLDLRTLARGRTKDKVQTTLAAYRAAFARLAAGKRSRQTAREEKIILEAIRRTPHKHRFKEFSENLKVQRGQRENTIRGLLAAEPYFQKMEAIFGAMGVPRELTRLTLVESSFDFNALSKVGALGVWQFMKSTADEYLTLNSKHKIDERLSPWKSTVAAGRLLQWNYQYLGNWVLAVTAYNHGIRKLPRFSRSERALFEAQTPEARPAQEFKKVAKLFRASCKSTSPLGWASRNYYSEFLAVLHAEAYRSRFYGEPPESFTRPVHFGPLAKSITGQKLAMENGLSLPEFKRLNPDVQNLRLSIPKGLLVALPAGRDDFTELLRAIGNTETQEWQLPTHANDPESAKKDPSG